MTSEHIRHRDEGLVLQRELMSSILTTGQVLDDEHWSRTTTCPPWSVRDLIAHLARGAETFSAMLEAGLRGERTLSISLEEREQRQRDLSALTERELLTTVRSSQEVLQEKLARLEGDALEALCPHTRGLQPAWWFVDQRLSELAFHGWDLHVSLGTEREIPPAVGRFLLPTLLTRNLPTWSKATGEVNAL